VNIKTQRMLEIVKLLALDSESQRQALPPFVDLPDELVCLFGDQYDLLTSEDLAAVGSRAQQALATLGGALSSISGNASLFSLEALDSAGEWEAVRRVARDLLNELSLKPESPRIDWVTYVPSVADRQAAKSD
jgi:hypothetical protein